MHSRLLRSIYLGTFGIVAVLCRAPVHADPNTPTESRALVGVNPKDGYPTRLTQLLQDLDREQAVHPSTLADGSAASRPHFAPIGADRLANALDPAPGGSIVVVLGARDRAGRLTIARLLNIEATTAAAVPRKSSRSALKFERSSFALLPAEDGSLVLPSAGTPPLENVTVDDAMALIARRGTAAFIIETPDSQAGGAARTLAVVPDSLHIDIGSSVATTGSAGADLASMRPSRDGGEPIAISPAPTPAIAAVDPPPPPALSPAPPRPDRPRKPERTPEELRADEAARQASFTPPPDNPLPPDNLPP